MENIEIKARVENPERIKDVLKILGPTFIGLDHQIDTYFRMTNGRCKLRESSLSGSHLIIYLRENLTGPKRSVYHIIPIDDKTGFTNLFNKMQGIQVVIEKTREIYLYDNIRIHLDNVKKLGNFIEFEAVMDDKHHNKNTEIAKIKNLLAKLEIKEENLIKGSYENLIELLG